MYVLIQMNSLIHCVMSTTYYTSMCEGQLLITLLCVQYLLHCLHMDSEQYTIHHYHFKSTCMVSWYKSPYILPVCGCPEARPRGVTANVEDIRGRILRVSGVYLTYTTVTHALGAIKCTITELGVYASIYTPSYRPISNDVMWYNG